MITLLYVFDSLRFDHVGCFNKKAREITPNLNLLAEQSIKCFNHIAPANWTLPSLSSILTGKTPQEINVNYSQDKIPTAIKRIPQYYSEMGYKTIGISANPYFSRVFNATLGFDIFKLLLNFEDFDKRDLFKFASAKDINKVIFEVIKQNKSENIFIMIWGLDTHNPYYIRDKNITKFVAKEDKNKIYSLSQIQKIKDNKEFSKIQSFYKNMVYQTDHHIGRIIEFLRGNNLFSSSTIAILSDHGETLSKNNFGHCKPPLKEQLHVPFILKTRKNNYPDKINHLTGMDNILPTLLKVDFNLNAQKSIFENYREYIYSTRAYSKKIPFYESIMAINFQLINYNYTKKFFSPKNIIKLIIKKILRFSLEEKIRGIFIFLEGKNFFIKLKKKELDRIFSDINK